ncbi:uncharacterized protein LOC133185079 [Saccostrea echinata]|uniref:uncharacterized protein LOC133185079 n=1 Tax=Saccostrea echinata TaxID=191078 RepID=UPI002A83A066|nr:uncharacterized protein LOC133185079 [Saccostrea echinata]
MTAVSVVELKLYLLLYVLACTAYGLRWRNDEDNGYPNDPHIDSESETTEESRNGGQQQQIENYATKPTELYSTVTKVTRPIDPNVTPEPIPMNDSTPGEPMPQVNDIMDKLNARKIMNIKDGVEMTNGKRLPQQYNLGKHSGYRWVLYREPLAKRLQRLKQMSAKGISNPYPFVKFTPTISQTSLSKLIKNLPSKGRVYGTFPNPSQQVRPQSLLLSGSLKGYPIFISISPTFKARDIKSAAVVGYGLRSLFQHRVFPQLGSHYNNSTSASTSHHIVKRSYRNTYRGRRGRYYIRRKNRSVYRRVRRRHYRRPFRRYRRPKYRKRPIYRKKGKRYRLKIYVNRRHFERGYSKKQKYKKSKKSYRVRSSGTNILYHTGNYKGGYSQAYWAYLQKYYPKIYLHYLDGSYSKKNYQNYYKTYLTSYLPSHVKGYNKKGYHLGSYKAGIDISGLKTPPPPPKQPKTFRLNTEEPHLENNSCPYAWLKYAGSCYYFSRDELSWYKATMTCVSMGGYLAVVNSAHENTYLRNFLIANEIDQGAWIGLNQISDTEKHSWRWGFSTKLCHKFDWFGDEPEFHKHKDYNCGIMWHTYRYHWHLESCIKEHYYICELKAGKPCKCRY